jgi:hypothetical protein
LLKRYAENPVDVFLEFAPASLRSQFTEKQKQEASVTLSSSDYMTILSDAMHVMENATSRGINQEDLLASGCSKAICEILLWTAIVLAIGALIAISQGALIAPLIALEAGIVPVLAAITGLTEGWITAAVAAGGFTFGKLISAACS